MPPAGGSSSELLRFQNQSVGYAVQGNEQLRPERSANVMLGAEWVDDAGFALNPQFYPFYDFTPVLSTLAVPERTAGIPPVGVGMPQVEQIAEANRLVHEAALRSLRIHQLHPGLKDVKGVLDADGVVFHVGSHLGAGFDAGVARAVPALEMVLEACSDTTWLLIENSAGAGGTIGRSIAEIATLVDRLGRHPRLGVCLDSCHLYVSGVDVTDRAVLDDVVSELDGTIGLDRLRALHVNDAAAPLGSNRDRHANVLEGAMGEGLGVFLAHPQLQGLPAVMEVPGPDNHGPDAAELEKVRALHARSLARPTGRKRASRSSRKP